MPVRVDDGLHPVAEVELGEDAGHVRLDVSWLSTSVAAISLLDRPSAIRRSTSSSRVDSGTSSGVPGTGLIRSAYRPTSRRVTSGASSPHPVATVRMPCSSCAGGASLSRNPLAPARNASYTYSSRLNVVTTRTLAGFATPVPANSRVASMPSSTGIRTSITTTSGESRSARSIAARPSPHSPTTSMSGCASMIVAKPVRISAWSSHTSTRTGAVTTGSPPGCGRARRSRRPACPR